jgi:hypothetical protein
MSKSKILFISIGLIVTSLFTASSASAASVAVTGKAKVLNTDNSYLDFSNYNSNVVTDNSTGIFSGYAFLEDIGWIAFGTTDNTSGPVVYSTATGNVTGKAKSLTTGNFLDFTNYNSSVDVDLTTGSLSGYVFSEDVGWINFSDTGVQTSVPTSAPSASPTPPTGLLLDSPGHNSYTSTERPTFRWRAPTTGTITKYTLDIDNGESGDIFIDNIPSSGTVDVTTATYTIHYEGFSDSDTANNYVSVTTRSSANWGSSGNDGKLKEGKRTWTVRVYEAGGGTESGSREVFVDYSSPSVTVTQLNNFVGSTGAYTTTDTTPTLFGRITDQLVGDGTSGKVVSGPESIEIKIERKDGFGQYVLHSLATVKITEMYWGNDGSKVTDRSANLADKYSSYSFTPSSLQSGTYRIGLIGKDTAGNRGATTQVYIYVNVARSIPFVSPPAEEERTEEAPAVISEVPTASASPIARVTPTPTAAPVAVASAGPGFLSSIGNFFKNIVSLIGNVGRSTIAFISNFCRSTMQTTGHFFAYLRNFGKATMQMIAGIFRQPRMIATRVQKWFSYSVGSFSEIVLNNEPTRITDVKIAEVGKDYAVIEWKTNHYTKNNKINYGESTEYGNHAFAEDFTKDHKVRIEGLEGETSYKFEVMSQNQNYVYDSFHEFTTKSEE